ncbi:MAG: rRNA maturation RNase YbeY [Acutalibacteraceae bacterium]|nr:rRNA maturation RNase YbeY [Acutalibacteraceae bacterium]
MAKIKVEIINNQKSELEKGTKLLIRKTCNAVISCENFEQESQVSVLLVDNSQIKDLNMRFRKIDRVTDVLSFPLCENGEFVPDPATKRVQLGDIVISVEKAVAQAEMFGHSVRREIAYLTCHSMLHLLGYDHVNGGLEKVRMREHEEAVMELLGLTF